MEDFLLQVRKPARYIGSEWNIPKKDFDASDMKFALIFPDLYEVGMSNLGVRIIYGLLNSLPDVSCERFFSCETDMAAILRESRRELLSLESQRRLREFDIAGFSLGSELDYTNVLEILDLCAIPKEASLRDHTYPLVIAGGPCVLNPEPMHEFFDLFVIGEAEDLILELAESYKRCRQDYRSGKLSKEKLLLILSRIEGVYVPSFYSPVYDSGSCLAEFTPKVKDAPLKVKKRIVGELDRAYFPEEWLLPYIQIVHDRITLEIMRGCANRCRFCQARSQYYPLRTRSIENIIDMAKQAYKHTGYEEISLGGLSVSDYPGIENLLLGLTDCFKDKAVGISLPSIKPRPVAADLSKIIAKVKKTGLTFAPEAGSGKLRSALGKDFNEEEFFGVVQDAYSSGYQHVKLYFMVGLPDETDRDLDAIIDLAKRVSELRRKVAGSAAQVNISINALIPKPHTPFQWFAMDDMETIERKYVYLKKKISAREFRRLKLNFHDPGMSIIEGTLSRGDRRLSAVIKSAFNKGARFDAWADHFNFQKWQEAFSENNIDPYLLYLGGKTKEVLLPWDFIDTGIAKDRIREESELILAEADKISK